MSKRGHGDGSITKWKKNGEVVGYQVRVTLPDGSRKAAYVRTYAEAREKKRELLRAVHLGALVASGSQPVRKYLASWLDATGQSVRPRTLDAYRLCVNRLDQYIGGHRLDALKPAHLRDAYTALLERGLSPRSVEQCHVVLHTALHQAVREELLGRNPCDAVRPPKPRRVEMKTLTPGQVRTLVTSTHDDRRLGALWVLAVTSGLRSGEACGLKWDDIDLDTGTLTVRRALQRQKGEGLVFVEPKTARSRRTLRLAPETVAALRRHKAMQNEDRLRLGGEWHEEKLIFTTESGGRLDPGNVRESFGRRLKGAGLPAMRFHDLRHTAATYLFSQGKHPAEVAAILGHSTVTLTLNTYTHVLPQHTAQTLACMGDLFPARSEVS